MGGGFLGRPCIASQLFESEQGAVASGEWLSEVAF